MRHYFFPSFILKYMADTVSPSVGQQNKHFCQFILFLTKNTFSLACLHTNCNNISSSICELLILIFYEILVYFIVNNMVYSKQDETLIYFIDN